MEGQPIVFKNDKLQRNQPHVVEYKLKVTGAKTSTQLAYLTNPVILQGYDAADLTQAKVEAFLGHVSTIPCAICFDAVSLGADVMGFVLDMNGQTQRAIYLEVSGQLGGVAIVPILVEASQVALTSSLSTALAAADGDMYGRIVVAGLDAAATGHLSIKVAFFAK